VVHGWSRLMLAATHGSHDVHHTGAICSLAATTIVISRGRGLLKSLLPPLPTTLGTLPSVLGGDISQCLPVVARGWSKLGCFIAGSILGGDTTQLLGGVHDGTGRCLGG
jgi:hypothetical protein